MPPRPIADVEADILAVGDLDVLVSLAATCKGDHQWRPLKMPLVSQPFIRPRVATYCQRCKLVDLGWLSVLAGPTACRREPTVVTRDPDYTPFGPRTQPWGERPTEPLWEPHGGGRVITGELLDHGAVGVEVQVFSGGEFRSGRWFSTRAEAVAFGQSERARLSAYVGSEA